MHALRRDGATDIGGTAHYTGTMNAKPVPQSGADRIVETLHGVDGTVNAMRERRLSDPESFGDKIFKAVVPSMAGFIFGKLFELVWNAGTARKFVGKQSVKQSVKHEARQNATHGIAFAIVSAAFGALVAQLSERGSQALVDRRHRKHR